MAKIYTPSVWDDEVLSADPRFDIKENGGAAFKANMQISQVTNVITPGTNADSEKMTNIEDGIDALDTLLDTVNRSLTQKLLTAYTTAGTSTAYTLTTTDAPALATNERWRVIFNATSGATPTLNRDGKGAKPLRIYDALGALVAPTAATLIANMRSDIVYDGTYYIILDSFTTPPATAAEIDTGTDAAKPIATSAFVASKRNIRHIEFKIIDPTTACAAATTVGGDLRLPTVSGTIVDCGFYHDIAASSTGTEIIDMHLAGSTIMTTNKMAGAAGEKSSEDGGSTQPTITTSAYTANAILTVDIDTAHTGTVPLGLTVWLDIREG